MVSRFLLFNRENNFLKANVYGILLSEWKAFFTIEDGEVAGSRPVAPVKIISCGCSSVAEPWPSKPVAWVRSPSPAPFIFIYG